jgi:hypothetical protein
VFRVYQYRGKHDHEKRKLGFPFFRGSFPRQKMSHAKPQRTAKCRGFFALFFFRLLLRALRDCVVKLFWTSSVILHQFNPDNPPKTGTITNETHQIFSAEEKSG